MAGKPRELAQPDIATEETTQLAPLYRVLVHNDDATPMDFVVGILVGIFSLDVNKAMKVMLEAHMKGIAHVVTLPLEEAEHRCERAHSLSRPRGWPLTFTYEPER